MDIRGESQLVLGKISQTLHQLATFQSDQSQYLSPQLTRRLLQLVSCELDSPTKLDELAQHVAALFSRLLVELIQAQCNTKQLEQAYIRHIESIGCSIRDPELLDHVIELLIKIYKAAGQCGTNDISYERKILIKYIMNELGPGQEFRKKLIERIIQTIYRCSCFHVFQLEGASSRFSLRAELCEAAALRQQLDIELINLAQAARIRLPPENWAYLLHGRSTPVNIAKMQSILDKYTSQADVDELEAAIYRSGDRFGLSCFIVDLRYIEDLTTKIRHFQPSSCASYDLDQIANRDSQQKSCFELVNSLDEVLEKFSHLKHLFTIRQQRAKLGVF